MLILLILFLLIWFIVLKWRTPKSPLVDTVETVVPSAVGRLRSQWRSWRGALVTQPSSVTQQLQTWATQNLDEESELRAWLLALTEVEMLSLATRLHTFCLDLGFELDWLFDPRLHANFVLNEAMTLAVTAYCTAVWQTVCVRDDIHAYKAFLVFEQDPQKPENREFAQRFYAQLIANGLLPAPPPDLVLATEEQRDSYVLAAIRQVAQQDNFAFQQTLREVSQSAE